jgi:glycosyltransferase involved in cell wall biosynthesis
MNHKRSNAVIYYSSTDYSTGGQRLMGMQSANENFLKAYVAHSGQDEFLCFAGDRGFADFTECVRRFAAPAPVRTRQASYLNLSALTQTGCLYIPSIQVDALAWLRRRFGQRTYAICGLTHTTASPAPMATLRNVVFGPTQSWDAIICTSRAVKASCEYVVQTWCDYFCQRFGLETFTPPMQFPVIPLGVDTAAYDARTDASAARSAWRTRLGIGENDVAFLFVGRLSAHGKAHPVAMYRALDEASRHTSTRLHLIQSGWFANQGIEKGFREGARELCPSVQHAFVDGRQPAVRQQIWFAADVFISLSDNIQETFGLTPIEAMAAGLPIVVTDWNGYRDTVRDGVDGFCIPTLAPRPHTTHDLAFLHELDVDNYDHYIGGACQITSVDTAACTRACLKLIENPDLRRQMGAAGKQRANDVYDWKHVIAAYQSLWQELDARRQRDDESVPLIPSIPINPAQNDPFALFAAYPTAVLEDDAVIALRPGVRPQDYKKLRAMRMNQFGHQPEGDVGVKILERIQKLGWCTLADLTAGASDERRTAVSRALLWSAKVNLVSIGDHNAGHVGDDEPRSNANHD